jgi:hypothetical protein
MHDLSAKPTIGQQAAGRGSTKRDVARESTGDAPLSADDEDSRQDLACDSAVSEGGACPHVDRNDARCGHRFSLGRIDQAFSVCFGAFHACPLFRRLSDEIDLTAEDVAGPQPLIEVRIIAHGPRTGARSAGMGALRATGS